MLSFLTLYTTLTFAKDETTKASFKVNGNCESCKKRIEKAAKTVFASFEPMAIEDFLKSKNTTSYNEFMKAKEEAQAAQQAQQIQK